MISATAEGSRAKGLPPRLASFGHERLISKPRKPSSESRPSTSMKNSVTVCPATLTRTRGRQTLSRIHGSFSLFVFSRPGLANPMELSIPPPNSATLGLAFPSRGSSVTDLVTKPPSTSRSSTSANSRPKPQVPAARKKGFWKRTPSTSVSNLITDAIHPSWVDSDQRNA